MSFLRSVIADARPSRAASRSSPDISASSLSSYSAFDRPQDAGGKPAGSSTESTLSLPDSGGVSQAPPRAALSQGSRISSDSPSTGLRSLGEDAKSAAVNTSRKTHFEAASSSEKSAPETAPVEVSIEPARPQITPETPLAAAESSSDSVTASATDMQIETRTRAVETQSVEAPLIVEQPEDSFAAVAADYGGGAVSPARAANEAVQLTGVQPEGVETAARQADREARRTQYGSETDGSKITGSETDGSEIAEAVHQARQAPVAIKKQESGAEEPAPSRPVFAKPAPAASQRQLPEIDAQSTAVNNLKSPDTAVAAQSPAIISTPQNTPPEALLQARLQSNQEYSGNTGGFPPTPARPAPRTPNPASVKIGQVDVFIESAGRSQQSNASKSRPASAFSSRHYLRRL